MLNKKVFYIKLIVAITVSLIFGLYYSRVFSEQYTSQIEEFQEKFTSLEKARDVFIIHNINALKKVPKKDIWKKAIKKKSLFLHVYKDDSLVYWSSNQLPLLRFADIHFPSEGVIHLQNGWYYSKIIKKQNYQYCASFLIKKDYSLENDDLKNEFSKALNLPFSAYITFEQESGFPIYSKSKKYLFSIFPNTYQPANSFESIILFSLLLIAIIVWIQLLYDWLSNQKSGLIQWFFPFTIFLIRWFSIQFVWFGFMHTTESFDPSLYGSNKYFSSFFDYSLNIVIIIYFLFFLVKRLKKSKLDNKLDIIRITLLAFIFILIWLIVIILNSGLVENSSISLEIEKLFSLNFYSIIALSSIGILFYVFYYFSVNLFLFYSKISFQNKTLVLTLIGVIFSFYLFYVRVYHHNLLITDLFPILLFLLILLDNVVLKGTNRFTYYLIVLLLFSIVEVYTLKHLNLNKEKIERKIYANQLATEKDIVTEIEYSKLVEKINKESFIHRLMNSPRNMTLSDFDEMLERKLFNGFWERYEMNFNLFNEKHFSVINLNENESKSYDELSQIVSLHGIKSEIDSNIYFINDYKGHYNYIIKQHLFREDSTRYTLFCTLKSKKIPEEIGFPRLLISSQSQVFESLKNYSIGKYYNNHLVNKYGAFKYPTTHLALTNFKKSKTGFYNFEGYSHFILVKSNKNIVVISKRITTSLELITSVAYLFCLFVLILFPFITFNEGSSNVKISLFSLSSKIQLVLISVVFISLFAFGWGSGLFVQRQYNEYNEDLIREKLNSVNLQLSEKIGNKNQLSIEEDGNNIEILLESLAKVFITDINLYDKEGFLLGTSRSKLFNIGLLSEQMNSSAFYQMDIRNKSEYIHNENIGALQFSSAYSPLYNRRGKFLGYLNLQHFGQQKEYETKIQQFLVAIINVFMLLLTISIILAIIVSNWVTSPLRIIQENFVKIQFGRQNQPIVYHKKDEIGTLVSSYNQKLEELEAAAIQLAQSERESAWREMAKQVAHEIKNPLTPMKLSIQHLMRTFDRNDEFSQQKLERVANSLIEQIDGLAKIANEFSSFAKLPQPIDDDIDLLPHIRGVVDIFSKENEVVLETLLNEVFVFADKDLLIRVFNNLIKNAIQAIQGIENGKVIVRISKFNSNYWFEVIDNGSGIVPEIHSKIFVPYFTTKGTGTGLGLAMVKQIINNQRGDINFSSSDGLTIFKFYLPEVR